MRLALFAAAAALVTTAAQAATIAAVGTSATGGSFTATGGTIIAVNDSAYWQTGTAPASEWIWVDDASAVNAARFELTFDLTGYDLSTVSFASTIGIDNYVDVFLNGTLLGRINNAYATPFTYTYADAAFLQDGTNVLRFDAVDTGGPAAFRAAITITGDALPPPAPVPLPAGAALLGLGLGALALRRKV